MIINKIEIVSSSNALKKVPQGNLASVEAAYDLVIESEAVFKQIRFRLGSQEQENAHRFPG